MPYKCHMWFHRCNCHLQWSRAGKLAALTWQATPPRRCKAERWTGLQSRDCKVLQLDLRIKGRNSFLRKENWWHDILWTAWLRLCGRFHTLQTTCWNMHISWGEPDTGFLSSFLWLLRGVLSNKNISKHARRLKSSACSLAETEGIEVQMHC